ncbi:hypothetical protein BBOU_0614 [Bifidobacterium boum]|uniref:Uncharacterized protein n=1 Tax=Bifidobacterium boum TaxID=78343 RepID=A0A086ZPN5_9BIFI|nr:hypothetical protein BBOU_0614 [Bifidobacterium boum]
MRGEHFRELSHRRTEQGSSPHARGTHGMQVVRFQRIGIIPACAGNTMTRRSKDSTNRDHPRMRGEHKTQPRLASVPLGSSPHARGTRKFDFKKYVDAGIIPACAGNTQRSRAGPWRIRDHPRMRGEHIGLSRPSYPSRGSSPHARGTPARVPRNTRRIAGSSPHARGTPDANQHCHPSAGIIPACAGNTHDTV